MEKEWWLLYIVCVTLEHQAVSRLSSFLASLCITFWFPIIYDLRLESLSHCLSCWLSLSLQASRCLSGVSGCIVHCMRDCFTGGVSGTCAYGEGQWLQPHTCCKCSACMFNNLAMIVMCRIYWYKSMTTVVNRNLVILCLQLGTHRKLT